MRQPVGVEQLDEPLGPRRAERAAHLRGAEVGEQQRRAMRRRRAVGAQQRGVVEQRPARAEHEPDAVLGGGAREAQVELGRLGRAAGHRRDDERRRERPPEQPRRRARRRRARARAGRGGAGATASRPVPPGCSTPAPAAMRRWSALRSGATGWGSGAGMRTCSTEPGGIRTAGRPPTRQVAIRNPRSSSLRACVPGS